MRTSAKRRSSNCQEEDRLWFVGSVPVYQGTCNDSVYPALQTGAPASLLDYLGHCRTLALDRTCSDDPILSFPSRQEGLPRPRPFVQGEKSYRERTAVEAEAKINIKNALKAGKSPKKEHEVDRFGTLGPFFLSLVGMWVS